MLFACVMDYRADPHDETGLPRLPPLRPCALVRPTRNCSPNLARFVLAAAVVTAGFAVAVYALVFPIVRSDLVSQRFRRK